MHGHVRTFARMDGIKHSGNALCVLTHTPIFTCKNHTWEWKKKHTAEPRHVLPFLVSVCVSTAVWHFALISGKWGIFLDKCQGSKIRIKDPMMECSLRGDVGCVGGVVCILFVCLLLHELACDSFVCVSLLYECARVSCKINERFYHRGSQWVEK